MSDTVSAIHQAILFAAKKAMRLGRVVPRPQVHLFVDDPDQPYVGCVTVREFDRGEDAVWAIRGLGYPAATLPASRVLVMWEDGELLLSLNAPHEIQGQALVVLDATLEGHTLTRYPFAASAGAGAQLDLRWDEPRTTHRPILPGPVAELLDIWREGCADDFGSTIEGLVDGGYVYTPVDTPSPTVESVHHAVGAALETGAPAAVEQACQALRQVLGAMSRDDPRRGAYLVDLSLILQLRYENSGDLDDVDEAVHAAHDAANYPDIETPAKRLNVLGTALRIRYEQTGERDALREAISVGRDAVAVLPAGDHNLGTCLVNLALAVHASFMADGDAAGLAEALSTTRQALGLLDSGDRRYESVATNLVSQLVSKYNQTGDLAVLDEAIEVGRSAVAGSTSSGWLLAAQLSNLGRALEYRHRRAGDLDSLREAIRAQRRALTVAPPDHADRTIYQLNLSGTLRALFNRTGDREDLDEAFAVAREAVSGIPAGHPFRINHLSNLATIHQVRYTHTAEVGELDTAEELVRTALAAAAATHPQRPMLLSVLGEVLHARSEHTDDAQRLDEATRTTRDALDIVADDDPTRGAILRTLADLCEARHRTLGDENALPEAIELLRTAAALRTSSMRSRVDAARRWGDIAASAGRIELAGEGLATAVELLPLLAARSMPRYDSEYWISQFGGLASDAAALALTSGTPDRAVELLELGRTVLIAQALDIRTDLSGLRARDPGLADRFEWLSARLETEDGESAEGRRDLADELDKVIAAVRDIAGMDRFLLPPAAADLGTQAGQGPIIIVNVSKYRSDALLLTKDGLRVRPLPGVTPTVLGDQVNRFLTALRTDCRASSRPDRERGEHTVADTLAWLWDAVASPVLDSVDPAPGQRVWWVPTGLLSFLPLHAASSAAGESVLDRIVSSYTPSVRALTHARATAGEPRTGRTLVVGMPHTPGATDLPGALRETRLVADRAPNPHTIVGPGATRAAVTAALRNCAWAHFVCHATTAPSPSDSHLLLHDHEQRPLNAATISRERLSTAALAYLSACHTAVPTTDLADEVIHIAAAFHLAGFPRVIGTLWAVSDTAATTIARRVYTGLTDADRTPQALHDAVVRMRDDRPRQPSLWASHIHIGI